MNEITPVTPTRPANATSGLVPRSMDEAIRLSEWMASARMLPKHLQGDVGTCLMVVEQAMRWNMSPFAVAACTSNIGGKLMFEGKLVAAAAYSNGAIMAEFDYDFTGDPLKPDTLAVVVSATRASDGQKRTITLRWSDAKTDNKFWKIQPEQQLVYAGARVWCRRWAPGVILGVYSPEEFNRDDLKPDTFAGPTIDAQPEPPTANHPKVEVYQTNPSTPPAPKRTIRTWMDEMQPQLQSAADDNALLQIINTPEVKAMVDYMDNAALKGKDAALREWNGMLAEAFERVRTITVETNTEDETDPDDIFPLDRPLA